MASSFVSRWQVITGQLTRHVRAAWPLLSWLFIALVLYAFVGGSIFPGWWKRFLFSGGIVDGRFWKVALEFFLLALRAGHPVALVTLVFLPLFCGWALFTMGRVGYGNVIGSIAAAPRVLVSLAVAVLMLTLIGLAVYPEEYLTPDEVHADLQKIRKRWDEVYSRSVSDAPTPPESGFYFFLDGPRVARSFNTLQKDVVVAQETVVEEGGTERRAGINLKTISGETVARSRIETSVQTIPTAPTPERQALWLIQSYRELDLAVELRSWDTEPESYEAKTARASLLERGVTLTPQQVETLRAGDAKVLAARLAKPNAPLLYAGKLLLSADTNGIRVTVKSGGGADVTVSGVAPLAYLDDSMRTCATAHPKCELDGKLLAIIFRTSQTDSSIRMDVIPLAMW